MGESTNGEPVRLEDHQDEGTLNPAAAAAAAEMKKLFGQTAGAPTEGQRHLERLLVVRNSLAEAADAQATVLANIRGVPAQKRERSYLKAAEPHTAFFTAAEQIVGDLEDAAKRIAEQTRELMGKF